MVFHWLLTGIRKDWMIVAVIEKFAPIAQGELFHFWNMSLILDILEIQILKESDFIQLAFIIISF